MKTNTYKVSLVTGGQRGLGLQTVPSPFWGRPAYDVVNRKITDLQKDIETWREVTFGADFEN
jgi:hypothetical protein